MVHHPDKGGDTEFFTSVRERFERIAGTFADMQVELVASWQPFWDNCQCTFGWRDEESGRHARTEEELPDDAFEQTQEELQEKQGHLQEANHYAEDFQGEVDRYRQLGAVMT